MQVRFDNKNIGGILFSPSVQRLCNSEATKIYDKLKNTKTRSRVKKKVDIKRKRYGVAIYKACLNKTMFENTKRDFINAIRKQ